MTIDPETRLSLIAKLTDRENDEAWAEFVAIYQPVIQRFLAKYGFQFADAAEVTQEVLAGVVQSADSWGRDIENGTFRGWLYRLTRNKAVDLLRKKARSLEINPNSNLGLSQIAHADSDSANSDFQGEFEHQTHRQTRKLASILVIDHRESTD